MASVCGPCCTVLLEILGSNKTSQARKLKAWIKEKSHYVMQPKVLAQDGVSESGRPSKSTTQVTAHQHPSVDRLYGNEAVWGRPSQGRCAAIQITAGQQSFQGIWWHPRASWHPG